jgi:hypothetical protein
LTFTQQVLLAAVTYTDAITGEALYYNATIKHLGEYSHAKNSSINAVKQQTQKLPKLFCIGKCRNKI